jgi:transposase InsO family protein
MLTVNHRFALSNPALVSAPAKKSFVSVSSPIFACSSFTSTGGGASGLPSQFTSLAFTELLKSHEIAISMDGKGAWRDNVFVERLWRTIKYEEVYLRAYASVSEARASLGRYIDGFYNTRRPHSSLDGRTPDDAYFTALPSIPMAA